MPEVRWRKSRYSVKVVSTSLENYLFPLHEGIVEATGHTGVAGAKPLTGVGGGEEEVQGPGEEQRD